MRLGPYEIDGEVGRGAMGVVYRARDPAGRSVAIKLLSPATSREALARFDRERRLLAELGVAAGFVPLIDARTSEHGPYLVMPLIDGGTLRQRLDAHGPIPIERVAPLGARLARAVAVAHARGIVHRDLKPGNVLFTRDGVPLIADLGLGKHFGLPIDGNVSQSLSRTGEFKGTLGYVAPEQMNDSKTVGPTADVYSLGALLYECIIGRTPFDAPNPVELLTAILNAPVTPIARLRRETPRWLGRAVERSLARDPERRFATADAFADALEAGGRDEPRASRRRRRFGAIEAVAAAAAVAFVAGVVAVFAIFGRREDADRTLAATTASSELGSRPNRTANAQVAAPLAPSIPAPYDRAVLEGCRIESVWRDPDVSDVPHPGIGAVAFLGDAAESAVVVDERGAVRLVDLATASTRTLHPGDPGREQPILSAIAADSRGDRVIFGRGDGHVEVLDVVGDRRLHASDHDPVGTVAISADGTRAAWAHGARTIRLWTEGRTRPTRLDQAGGDGGLGFLPDGKLLVGGPSGAPQVVDPESGAGSPFTQTAAFSDPILAFAVPRHGELALSGHVMAGVLVWAKPNVMKPMKPVDDIGATAVALDPGGVLGASVDTDLRARLWDLAAAPGEGLLGMVDLKPAGDRARSIAVAADARTVVIGTRNGALVRVELRER